MTARQIRHALIVSPTGWRAVTLLTAVIAVIIVGALGTASARSTVVAQPTAPATSRAPLVALPPVNLAAQRSTVPAAVTPESLAPVASHSEPAATRPIARPPVSTASSTASTTDSSAGYGCAAALQYLHANAAPGSTVECPANADGRQAMTCVNLPPQCTGLLIEIAVPCPAAYMNEASNSWVLLGLRQGPIDPYGYCH